MGIKLLILHTGKLEFDASTCLWISSTFSVISFLKMKSYEMSTYIEKRHYHVGKKVAEVSFVWHLDTLFKSNDISVGTCLFCRKYRWAHSFLRPLTGNQCLLAIMYNFITVVFHTIAEASSSIFYLLREFFADAKILQ